MFVQLNQLVYVAVYLRLHIDNLNRRPIRLIGAVGFLDAGYNDVHLVASSLRADSCELELYAD